MGLGGLLDGNCSCGEFIYGGESRFFEDSAVDKQLVAEGIVVDMAENIVVDSVGDMAEKMVTDIVEVVC